MDDNAFDSLPGFATLDHYQQHANGFASFSGNAAGVIPEKIREILQREDIPQELVDYIRDISVFLYPSSKLAGESGEIAEKLAKQIRDKGVLRFADVSPEDREAIKQELGDVLWYVAEIAKQLRFRLSEIADANLAKLSGRVKRGTLLGDGDNR